LNNYSIYQVHHRDNLSANALAQIYASIRGLRKELRDFWWSRKNHFDGDIVMLIALSNEDGQVSGVSGAAITKDRRLTFNSMICVGENHRNKGLGNYLLASTLSVMDVRYPDATYRCFFGKKNEAAIKICQHNNLELYSEGVSKYNVEYVEYRKPRCS